MSTLSSRLSRDSESDPSVLHLQSCAIRALLLVAFSVFSDRLAPCECTGCLHIALLRCPDR